MRLNSTTYILYIYVNIYLPESRQERLSPRRNFPRVCKLRENRTGIQPDEDSLEEEEDTASNGQIGREAEDSVSQNRILLKKSAEQNGKGHVSKFLDHISESKLSVKPDNASG